MNATESGRMSRSASNFGDGVSGIYRSDGNHIGLGRCDGVGLGRVEVTLDGDRKGGEFGLALDASGTVSLPEWTAISRRLAPTWSAPSGRWPATPPGSQPFSRPVPIIAFHGTADRIKVPWREEAPLPVVAGHQIPVFKKTVELFATLTGDSAGFQAISLRIGSI